MLIFFWGLTGLRAQTGYKYGTLTRHEALQTIWEAKVGEMGDFVFENFCSLNVNLKISPVWKWVGWENFLWLAKAPLLMHFMSHPGKLHTKFRTGATFLSLDGSRFTTSPLFNFTDRWKWESIDCWNFLFSIFPCMWEGLQNILRMPPWKNNLMARPTKRDGAVKNTDSYKRGNTVRTYEQHQMLALPAINDRKMHSMVSALGRSEHAKPRAIGLCNHSHQN